MADVPVSAIVELEADQQTFHRHIGVNVRAALENAGVLMIEEDGKGIGVKLKAS